MTFESLTNQENQNDSFFLTLGNLIIAPKEQSEEGIQPMSNHEFYAMSALILAAYALYAVFLGPLGSEGFCPPLRAN